MAPRDLANSVEWVIRWHSALNKLDMLWHLGEVSRHKRDYADARLGRAIHRLKDLWTSSGHFWLP